MRNVSMAALGVLAITGLAACGKSDEAVRSEARTRLTANCPRSATPEVTTMLAQEGVTIAQVCSCAIDRYLGSVTVAQIRDDAANPTPPRISAASAQCVTELVTAAHANSSATANEATPSEAAPAGAAEDANVTEDEHAEE